jgi:hypothetical protein
MVTPAFAAFNAHSLAFTVALLLAVAGYPFSLHSPTLPGMQLCGYSVIVAYSSIYGHVNRRGI